MNVRRIVCLWVCIAAMSVCMQAQWLDEEGWVEQKLASMSVEEQLGQLFIYKVMPVNTPDNCSLAKRVIDTYHVGGFLFSGGNLEEQAKLTNYLQGLSTTPLMITFDGEWGLAMRLKNTPKFPKNRDLGYVADDSLIYEYGLEVARQCREMGIHVNFAPVADVDSNPLNPVIGSRSFGSNPQQVAQKVVAYSRGLQQGGVVAVAKHFPGHGDTNVDSHKALPVLDFDRDRLEKIELVPFRAAVEAGVEGVMMGHLLVSVLDEQPASLSPKVVDFLRSDLHFNGLIFTDALEMGGVYNSDQSSVCLKAFMAGNDMLLVPGNMKTEMEAFRQALANGTITAKQVEDRCRRVLQAKYRHGIWQQADINLNGLAQRINTSYCKKLIQRLNKAVELGKAMQPIDEIVNEGLREEAYPGCQVLITQHGRPIYQKCFGHTTYSGTTPVTPDLIYDLASLTKTTATLLAVMKLYDERRFQLDDSIGHFLPELVGTDKAAIRMESLLWHQSGLPATTSLYQCALDTNSYERPFLVPRADSTHAVQVGPRLFAATRFRYDSLLISSTPSADFPLQVAEGMFAHRSMSDSVLHRIGYDVPLRSKIYRYSCLNFVLLKAMVEHVTGMPLDRYVDSCFYQPMRIPRLTFLPLRRFRKDDVVPTVAEDYLRPVPLQGYVHDELAAFQGGVSGNAGLFGNAQSVAMVYEMLLNGGVWEDRRYLGERTCRFFATHVSKISRRALGFDRPDVHRPKRSPCCKEAPATVVGHTGFTGTCAWADPTNHLVFVFLSNRVYPHVYDRQKFSQLDIRPRIQQAMYQAVKGVARQK